VRALLFDGPDYQGWVTSIVTDTADLNVIGYNDAASSLLLLPGETGAVTVTEEFTNTALDPAWNWNAWATGPSYALTDGQLQMTLPAGDFGDPNVSPYLQRYDLGRGDFDIRTHLLISPTAEVGYLAGLSLGFQLPGVVVFGLCDGDRLCLERAWRHG
jgi:hypothetical protein